jgi:glycolate oxidase FAD binding subunit
LTTLVPRSANEVTDAIRWAAGAGEALEVFAGGTRRGLGRPVDAPHVLDVSALSGVLAYEPEELILTALPGTPLAEIETLLATRGQCLAFEPPDLTALLAPGAGSANRAPPFAHTDANPGASHDAAKPAAPKLATLGGTIATGLSGPRRPKAGAARDHVLGISAASGRGEFFMGGGKVVKNVTGYDIPKLIAGSYGTLAVMTEMTIKVLPAPEDTRTLLINGMSTPDAVRTMNTILQSTADTSAGCHLPAGVLVPGKIAQESTTAFRLEGVTPSVEFRLSRLRAELTRAGSHTVLDRESSIAFWQAVRDVSPFGADANADDASRIVWRLSVPPAQGAEVLARIERSFPTANAFLDWGGALIWLALDACDEPSAALASAEKVRAALGGGHATLVRACAEVRRAVEVFQPQPAGLAALSNRVKMQFDPKQVLNPGRMYAGV